MASTVQIEKVNGRFVIGTDALTYCNTKYHTPYFAVISPAGEMNWQEKVYVGYGKHRKTYYVVENLQLGDLIQCAGGSGSNKYPFKGRVIAIDLDAGTLEVEKLNDVEFGNLVAERKKSIPPALTNEEKALVEALKALDPERRKLVVAAANGNGMK